MWRDQWDVHARDDYPCSLDTGMRRWCVKYGWGSRCSRDDGINDIELWTADGCNRIGWWYVGEMVTSGSED